MMRLRIVTPEKLILDQEVDSVTLPGSEGQMTILPGHAALAATLKAGGIFSRSGEKISFKDKIKGGFVEVLASQVLIIAEKDN